ncbi:MAG: hypothetical protein JJT94_07125 [Bernardetiaceae bacterium]|nr:hypothetical protein [Bernardetiaceae bacterium]
MPYFIAQLGILLLLLCACQTHQTAETTAEITEVMKTLPKKWEQLKRNEQQDFVRIESFEKPSARLELAYSTYQNAWLLRFYLPEGKSLWRILQIQQSKNQYEFYLEQEDSDKRAQIKCTQYTENESIFVWSGSLDFFKSETRYFTAYENLQRFEPIYDSKQIAKPNTERHGEWLFLEGQIGDETRKTAAYICIKDRENVPQFLKGVYFYEKFWRDLYLEYKPQNLSDTSTAWEIYEYPAIQSERLSGVFRGYIDESYRFAGKWVSTAKKQELAFYFEEKNTWNYEVQDFLSRYESGDGSAICIYYPQLIDLQSEEPHFNQEIIRRQVEAWKKEFFAVEDAKPKFQNCDIEINYHLLRADRQYISLIFYIKQQNKKLDILSMNYDLKVDSLITLSDIFQTESPHFQKRLQNLINKQIQIETEKQNRNQILYDKAAALRNVNFLPQNLRLMLYDTDKRSFFPIYIAYKDLEDFRKPNFILLK